MQQELIQARDTDRFYFDRHLHVFLHSLPTNVFCTYGIKSLLIDKKITKRIFDDENMT